MERAPSTLNRTPAQESLSPPPLPPLPLSASLSLTRELQALVVETKLLPTVRIELDVPKAWPPVVSQPQAVCEPRATAATALALHGAVLFMTKNECLPAMREGGLPLARRTRTVCCKRAACDLRFLGSFGAQKTTVRQGRVGVLRARISHSGVHAIPSAEDNSGDGSRAFGSSSTHG